MTKAEFVDKLAAKSGLTKKDAAGVVDAFVEVITEALKKGEDVQFTGFGKFYVQTPRGEGGDQPADQGQDHHPRQQGPEVQRRRGSQERGQVIGSHDDVTEGRLARPFSFAAGAVRERGEGECLAGISATGCWRPSRASVRTWSWVSTRSTARCPRQVLSGHIRQERYAERRGRDEGRRATGDFLSELLPAWPARSVRRQDPDRLLRGSWERRATRSYEEMVGWRRAWATWSSPTSSGATSAARPRRTPRRISTWRAPTP